MTKIVSRNEQTINIPSPNGGMNTTMAPQLIPDSMSIDAKNVTYNEVQSVDKRTGFTLFNALSQVITLYSTGSISAIASNIVTGSGTTWSGNINVNDRIVFGSESTFYTINAVNSDTQIQISNASHAAFSSTYKVTPNRINKLVQFARGTSSDLVAFAGKSLFTGGSGLTGSFTERTGATLTNNGKPDALVAQDTLYFCDGTTSSFQTMNTSYTIAGVGGSPPTDPKYLALFTIGTANYLAIAGHTTNRSRVDFSDANALSTWPAANLYIFGDRDGTDISGMAQQGGTLVVFKLNNTTFKGGGIYEFAGVPGSGQIRLVVPSVGCLSHHSIVAFAGTLIFLGVDRDGVVGVYQYDGTPSLKYLSEAIEPTLNALSFGSLGNAEAVIHKNRYYLSVRNSSGSYNNTVYVGDLRQADPEFKAPKWSWHDRSWNTALNWFVSGQGYMFSGSATNGFVNREDNGNADDTTDTILGNTAAIDAYVDSKWFALGGGHSLVELIEDWEEVTDSGDWNLDLRIYRDFQSQGSDLYKINLASNTLTWADVIYGVTPWQTATDKSLNPIRFKYPTFCRYFRKRYANNNQGQPFSVYPSRLVYKVEQRSPY